MARSSTARRRPPSDRRQAGARQPVEAPVEGTHDADRAGVDATLPGVKERTDYHEIHDATPSAASTARAISSRRSVSLATSCRPTGRLPGGGRHRQRDRRMAGQVEGLAQAQQRVARSDSSASPKRDRRRAERSARSTGDVGSSSTSARPERAIDGLAQHRLRLRRAGVVLGGDVAAGFEPGADAGRVVGRPASRASRRAAPRRRPGRSADRRRPRRRGRRAAPAAMARPRGAEPIERRLEGRAHVVGEPLDEAGGDEAGAERRPAPASARRRSPAGRPSPGRAAARRRRCARSGRRDRGVG